MDRTKNAPEQSQWLSKSQTTIIHNAPYSSSESNLESKMALFTKEILDRHDESSRNLKRNVNVMLKSFESNLDDLKLLIDFIRKTSLHQQKVAEGTLRFFKQEFSSFPSSNSPLMVKIGSVKDSYQAAAQSRLSACQEIVTLSLSPMQSFVDTAQVKFKELTKTLNSAMDSIAVLRHEAEQGAVACQNCIKNIEDLKTRIGSLPSFVVSKQLKSNASKAQRVFSKYEQDLKALNAERNKISKFLLPLLLAELESLEKDRLMLLHNRLSNIEKLHQQVFDDEKMVLRMFLESKNTVEPLGFLRSWSSVFSHNFQVANGSSTSPLSMQLATLFQSFAPLDDFEEPIDWIPTQQLSDVESAMKELLADLESKGSKSGLFSTKKSPTGVPEKVDGADQTSDSLGQSSHSGHPGFNFTLDKYSVFCHAIRDFESAGKVKFVKGDIIKLSKIPSRNETVLFGEVINHTPPYTAVWFSRAFVSVETQLKADVSLQQLLHCEVGQRYFYEYLKSEHSEEHLLFWILCNEYWNSPSSRQGSKLINAFIAESAPQPVNISGELRASLLLQGRSGSWPQDMFLPAQLEIFNMLKADNFIRFRHSSTFKHMLEDINSALHLKFSQSPTSP